MKTMKSTLLEKMKTLLPLAILLAGMMAAQAQTPAAALSAKIEALRKQRETAISESIVKANADYAGALDKLKSLYASDAAAVQMVAQEKAELAKVAVVALPPAVRIAAPLAVAAPAKPRVKPQIHKPEDLIRYLVGTRWNYFGNAQFLGDSVVLEFTGTETLTLNGKELKWKVTDKSKIWTEGNKEYSFSKDYDEFVGGWIPNPKDRASGRLVP